VTSTLRLSAVAVATTAAVLSAGGASLAAASPHTAQAAASHQIKSGKTSVSLDSKTANALLKDGFVVTPTGKAKFKNFVFSFPVTGGHYNAGRGKIRHAGGLKITKGTKHIGIKNLIVDPHSGRGTAVVTGHGRITAIKVGAPTGGSGGPHSVTFSGYSVTLSKPAIKVLDKKFHTKAFKKHPTLGIGSTTLHFKK
jgi:hypothetical protein